MERPTVSVVMPFAGNLAAARTAIATLRGLCTGPGDELILADNAGVVGLGDDGVMITAAAGERSPAHARNAGAARAHCDWILFLDADCTAPGGLLDAYFRQPISAAVGALAGEVAAAPAGETLAARYGAARSFLNQEAHLAHPYRPRAVAANLLVRRAAFEQIGGFYEGVRAAEDTDFSWRLQQAGWRLEGRAEARVEHRYRTTVQDLRRQWRGYAAGRAWLGRRYEGFSPEPAVRRAARRALRIAHGRRDDSFATAPQQSGVVAQRTSAPALRRAAPPGAGPLDRGRFFALDAILAAEELAGLALSNRPAGERHEERGEARVVLVADRFPARRDPLTELARTLHGARVEAAARPEAVDVQIARLLRVDYREDDGVAERALALAMLIIRHPARCARDLVCGRRAGPSLAALAPAALRLSHDRGARVHPIGGDAVRVTAGRLAALAGRRPDPSG